MKLPVGDVNDDLLAVSMSVIGVPALTIVSGDSDINTAATAEGLIIEDPETHLHPDEALYLLRYDRSGPCVWHRSGFSCTQLLHRTSFRVHTL